MKRIMSLVLVAMLTINLMQINSVSYAKELELNKVNMSESDATAEGSAVTDDLSISSTNAIGSMLESELTDIAEEQEQNNGYNVFSIDVEGTTATVEYEALEDCHLIVSIYDNEGNQMLGSGATDVSATETEATVTIDIDSMPTYFFVRAYLVEKDTLMPLCQEYKSELYTQAMQEFLAKIPEDFDPEKVLEIEEESNSFVVFSENTKLIPYNADYNTIEQMDETNREYIIANPDENFSALQVGDVFSYEYTDGQVLIVDIATIETQENKLIITGNEADMGEVFEYVRIDTDFSMEDASVDPSTCDEDVTYLGRTTADEDAEVANVEMLNTTNSSQKTTDTEVSKGKELKFDVGEKDADGNVKGLHGSLTLSVDGVYKVYEAPDAEYVELRIDVTINGTVEFAKEIEKNYELAHIAFVPAPGVTISFTPQITFEAKAAIKYEAEVKFVIGVKVECDEVVNISKKPKVTHKLAMEGTVFIGISLEPSIGLIHECVFKLSLTAKAGVEFQLESSDVFTNEDEGIQHDCVGCFEGEISRELEISGSIQLASIDFMTYTVNILNIKSKMSDMYVSLSHGEFGLKKCPHLQYRVTAMVVDTNNLPFEGVTICDKYETDEEGMVEFYLKRGKYRATAKKDGYIVNANTLDLFEIKDKEKLAYFIMIPDPNAGGSGSGENDDPAGDEDSEEIVIGSDVFPDANFRQYVLDEIDTNGNGKLSQEEIQAVTEINVVSNGICDLSGIETFTQLLTLDCDSNYQLTSLDVSNCTKLLTLNCRNLIHLGSLDISDCTQLQSLDCSNNKLTSLDVSNCTKLQSLDCSNIGLTSLDVSNCTQLQSLDCGLNKLTSLDVSDCTQLQSLDCISNQLTSLDVSNCTQLQSLNCGLNDNLASLDVSNCMKLQSLDCSLNDNLTNLDVSNCIQLSTLNCSDNKLASLDVSDCTQLQSLVCSDNALTSLDVSDCTQLQSLVCTNNKLTSLDVSDCTQLQSLDCAFNYLVSLDVGGCTKLQSLSCNHNDLANLDVSDCMQLQSLVCYSNYNMLSLNVSGCTQLQSLGCGDNYKLASLDVSDCTQLQSLTCDHNNLTSLDVSKNTELTSLDCNVNNLTSLDVSKNTELTYLDCSGNYLTSLDVSDCTKLQSLDCGGNNLTSLDVSKNTELTYLNCAHDVVVIGYDTSSASATSLDEVVEVEEPTANTISGENNASSEIVLEKNWITSTATDTQNSYNDLYPNEIYNFYVFQDAPHDTPFGSVFTENNLLYVKQYVSDENGSLNIEYSPMSDNTDATEVLVCAQKVDIANGYEVSVDNLTYNGTKQTPTVFLYVNDELLVGGKDFNIEGNSVVSEIGDYTLTLVGIGKYTGEVNASFSVVAPSTTPETGDDTKKPESGQQPSTGQPDTGTQVPEQSDGQQPTENQLLSVVGTQMTLSSGQYVITASSKTLKEVTFVKPKTSKKTSISIPATVKIDGYTYKVTAIGNKAFKNNKKLKTVTIGNNVKKIGKEAFAGCKKLKTVKIGKKLTTIGQKAFYNCKKLSKITITSAVLKSVGKNAIKGIYKKATIKVPKQQLKKYKKLFKSKTGYKKTMKIKK